MNSLDRKLTSVFKILLKGPLDDSKKRKIEKEFRNVRTGIIDEDFGKKIDFLFDEFSRPPIQRQKLVFDEAVEFLQALRDRGLLESATLIFNIWRDIFQDLSLQQMLNVAPNSASLKIWIKAKKIPARDVEGQLLANPTEIYSTVGADWLLAHSKPEKLLPLFDLLVDRQQRKKHLRPWHEALTTALKKDKSGKLLALIFHQPSLTDDRITALSEVIYQNRALFKMTIDILPTILTRKESNASAVKLVETLFKSTLTTDSSEREFITATLARLGAAILLAERRTTDAEASLAIIQKIMRQLRNLTKTQAQQSKTWIFENLSNEEVLLDDKLSITAHGARHIALAFEKADQGFNAKDILSVMARNLGLSEIGKKDQTAIYDPLWHEDVAGGLTPGTPVIINQAGWRINDEVVARAKVRKE